MSIRKLEAVSSEIKSVCSGYNSFVSSMNFRSPVDLYVPDLETWYFTYIQPVIIKMMTTAGVEPAIS